MEIMQHDSDYHFNKDLFGGMAVKFKNIEKLHQLLVKHIGDYNPDRFELVAVRIYYGKETVVTIYSLDKNRQEGSNFSKEKLPVHKFKVNNLHPAELLPFIEECNFTLTTGNYDLNEMEVINK
jgi:hypothetical protein